MGQITAFPFGVSSWGQPVGGSGFLPVMGGGGSAKAYFVDPANGSDGNTGLSPDKPLDTIAAAYAKTVDGQGDVVYLMNDGGTSGSARESAAITWSNSNTHLVGLGAPAVNQRARITPTSGSTDVDAYTPFLTLSGSGCIISNVSFVQGNSENGKASVGILMSGSRNYLGNVSVLTGQHANQGDETSYFMQVTGSENVVERCYIGTDTVAYGTAGKTSASVRFGSGSSDQATRNIFRDCVFPLYADADTHAFIRTVTAFDTQRWNLFEGCNFVNTGTQTLTAAVTWADTTGICLLKDCAFYGAADITVADSVYVQVAGATFNGAATGLGLYTSVDIS